MHNFKLEWKTYFSPASISRLKYLLQRQNPEGTVLFLLNVAFKVIFSVFLFCGSLSQLPGVLSLNPMICLNKNEEIVQAVLEMELEIHTIHVKYNFFPQIYKILLLLLTDLLLINQITFFEYCTLFIPSKCWFALVRDFGIIFSLLTGHVKGSVLYS